MKDLKPQDPYLQDRRPTRALRIVIILCIISALLSLKLCAQQYYPAGLGNANLNLWLTAADATTLKNPGGTQAINGDAIATWIDKSGAGNNAIQATTAYQPVNQTNALNNYSGVIFQNYNQYLTGPSGAYQTMVAVRSMPGTGHYQSLFASPANTDFSIRGGGASSAYTDGPNVNDWSYNTGATPTQWINGVQSLNGSNSNHILVAASNAPTNNTYSINSSFLSRGMNGNDPVFELLSYSTTLNTTQRQLLENYEATTWGLTSVLMASGEPLYTPPSAASYNTNLVGIGYTSSTDNFLTNAAGGTDGLGFSSGTGSSDLLNTAGFLMAAHNGQANTIFTNTTVTGIGAGVNRWNRSWNIQKSGGNVSGNVTFQFNFTNYNSSSAPSAANVITLLYNATDGTFATGTNKLLNTTSSISGNTVSLVVNASNLLGGYYTIIWGPSSVLPIVLSSFDARQQDNTGLLTWQVTSAGDAISFDIERSTDPQNFTVIGTETTKSYSYSFTDKTPAAGANYYRLKMTDADGSSIYSPVRVLNFAPGTRILVTTYPNPVTDLLQITTNNITGPVVIRLFTVNGVMAKTMLSSSPDHISLPMQDLPVGIYILEIAAGSNHYTQKIYKNS